MWVGREEMLEQEMCNKRGRMLFIYYSARLPLLFCDYYG